MAGYQLLRPSAIVALPNQEDGSVDLFPEIGLSRVRQAFALRGRDGYLDLTQEPISYPVSPRRGHVSTQRFGMFTGELVEYGDQISFRFLTGAYVDGIAIRALAASFGDHSRDDIEAFVESLSFSE